jgi:membrane associated rhomboid family serine protease
MSEAPASVCYRHTDRETYVQCTRCERFICPDCMRSASVGFQCPSCVADGHASIRTPQAAYGGRARANPEVVWALLGLNAVFFVLTAGSGIGFGGGLSELFQKLALTPSYHGVLVDGVPTVADGIAQGGYYRLLTSMFLHFGVVHLALNMYALYLVGPELERALGRLRFAALYLLSGLGGAALSYALGPVSEIAAGASGAVFGLFAAFWVLERRRGRDASGITVMIALNMVISFTVPNIDWRGHVGGLVAGALVTAALVYAPAGKQRALVQVLGLVVVAVLVVGVVAARTVQLTT